ncbi:MAG: tyrosine--tRNA ligase [Desulfobacteraceae bacterium]|nr:tyrosine--tRNA ligase [Desulfobacteraceae bacterium]
MNVIDILEQRGFVDATTHDEELRRLVENRYPVTCYVGFDPTAPSLHVGHLLPVMALSHMQRCGHQPIALVGGGTGLVGDPSGKTEMRQLLTLEMVEENAKGIKSQLSRFIDFDSGNAKLLNNADWLVGLKYIDFLRDIGRHFSVNRMIKAESYRVRLESEEGLNFIEFNYMLLQAYDFLNLYDLHGCRLQMGGTDQWGNIVAGIDLIRRMRQVETYGLTIPLVTTSSGAKMGKTAQGAVWLDPERTSPYDYYQYWVNTDDRDVVRFLSLFTFLPFQEIQAVEKLRDAELNNAKAVLAYEATKLAHGSREAKKAHTAAASMFGQRSIPDTLLPASDIPRKAGQDKDADVPASEIEKFELEAGIPVFKLYQSVGLTESASAARRLIKQGGAYINGRRVEDQDYLVTPADFYDSELVLRAGKKKYYKIRMKK